MGKIVANVVVRNLIPALVGALAVYLATNHPEVYASLCSGK